MTYLPPPGGYAPQTYAPPGQQYAPRAQAPAPAAPRPAAPAVVRGQRPEDPPASERRPEPRVALSLPPPEQLGIGAPTPAADVDWNAVHRRLHNLGSTSYQSQRTADGYRFTCLLPTADPSRTQRVEAQAASEAEAIRVALNRAEQWARGASDN